MALEDLFNATVDVLRPATTKDTYKGTVTLPMTTKATGVRCHVHDSSSRVIVEWDQQLVESTHRVLFSFGTNVVKGDVLHDALTGAYYGVGYTQVRRPIGNLSGHLVAECVETQV